MNRCANCQDFDPVRAWCKHSNVPTNVVCVCNKHSISYPEPENDSERPIGAMPITNKWLQAEPVKANLDDLLKELKVMRHILYELYQQTSKESIIDEDVFEDQVNDEMK